MLEKKDAITEENEITENKANEADNTAKEATDSVTEQSEDKASNQPNETNSIVEVEKSTEKSEEVSSQTIKTNNVVEVENSTEKSEEVSSQTIETNNVVEVENSTEKSEEVSNQTNETDTVEVEKSTEKSEETSNESNETENIEVENSTEKSEEASNQTNETDNAVNEVEKSVAEKSENEVSKVEIPMLDYDGMELSQINTEFEKLVATHPIQHIKNNADAIKNAFDSKFKTLLEDKKEAFIEDGGNQIDFSFSSPEKQEFNTLLTNYKKLRNAHYASQEKNLKENLEKRNAIIEELKAVIEKGDPKGMYNEYKALNDRWKIIGPVPRDRYNDVWKVYHHHVEHFYDLLHLNKSFRELDFKHNLEEKLKIINRAEQLADAEEVNIAFAELQDLHRVWKEEVGPVAREHREIIWRKFSEVTKKLHDRRHEFFKEQRVKTQELIEAKLQIVAEINNYDSSNNKTHKDWQNSIKEIESIRQKYFDLGKLPYSKSESIWQQLKDATKKFNTSKNVYYKSEKKSQSDNLKRKIELVETAESLKDSEDWEVTIQKLKKIQTEWKKIGHVPRKFSDDLWKRFKSSCNHFFDRLTARNDEANKEQNAVVTNKKAFLDEFKAKEIVTFEEVKSAIKEWKDLGPLPINARFLDAKFNKAIDFQLEKQDISKSDIEMLKFKNVVDNYLAQEDFRKLDNEALFVRKKADEIIKQTKQLENNLGFISNAKPDNPFVLNIQKGIDDHKSNLEIWQKKLKYLRSLDY